MKMKVLEALQLHLTEAVEEGRSHLTSLQEALTSEAKSTAGDKHETGRAMIHQEMRQVNDTLQRSQSTLRELTRNAKASVVAVFVLPPVCWSKPQDPWVLVGLPFGKLDLEGTLVLGVSSEAPLAKAWFGAKPGDEVRMGPSTFLIKALH